MISELVKIKNRLLKKHHDYETPNADEYRTGILSGIEVALQSIDNMIEEESNEMARHYGEEQRRK